MNAFAWNKYATVVYVDAPLNVGFSSQYTNPEPMSLTQISAYVINFVYAFFKRFPIIDDMKVYFAGSEMAGTYLVNAAD